MGWMLRRAGVDDLQAIMRLERATFAADAWSESTLLSELQSSHTHYLVAIATDGSSGEPEIDGYAGLSAPRGALQADIQTIAVAERARRSGLGRALMQQQMTEAWQRGAREMLLEVRADNPGAQTLYESLGFSAIAVRPGYYQPDNVDAVVMRAPLTDPVPGVANQPAREPTGPAERHSTIPDAPKGGTP